MREFTVFRAFHWGTFERFLLVFGFMVMLLIQMLLVGEVFADMGAQEAAPLKAAFSAIGLIFMYLIFTLFGEILEAMIQLSVESGLTERRATIIRSLGWLFASAGMAVSAVDGLLVIESAPELTSAVRTIGVLLVVMLAFRSIPAVLWQRAYDRLESNWPNEVDRL